MSFPSPGNLPDPGFEPGLPHGRQLLYHLGSHGSPKSTCMGSFEGLHHYLHYLHHSLKAKVKVKLLSHVLLFATQWTVAHQAPPSMGFSRQEYWSGLPFPFPGDLPDPGIEPRSSTLQAEALSSEPPTENSVSLNLSCLIGNILNLLSFV